MKAGYRYKTHNELCRQARQMRWVTARDEAQESEAVTQANITPVKQQRPLTLPQSVYAALRSALTAVIR